MNKTDSKTTSTPNGKPLNIPGGSFKVAVRGQVPRMLNPPQPPTKK